LARLHHAALPLCAVSAPAPLLSKLLSSLLSSPLVALLSLLRMKYCGRCCCCLRRCCSPPPPAVAEVVSVVAAVAVTEE
jgi:hypothetical protein